MIPSSSHGWIVDASVALKWFLPPDDEPDGDLARKLTDHQVRVTSLTYYEVGNVLGRVPGSSPAYVDGCLAAMGRICDVGVELNPSDYGLSVALAHTHGITFYDASYVAIAKRLGRTVISADRDLLGPGLAVDLKTATLA